MTHADATVLGVAIKVAVGDGDGVAYGIQLDLASASEPSKKSPANQKGDDTFKTTVGKLSARRIRIFRVYLCLGIILKVILNKFQNNA